MIIRHYAKSDIGKKRKRNEDKYRISDDGRLFLIADGMGGHSGGEIASKIAVDTIAAFIDRTRDDDEITWPYEFHERLPEPAGKLKTAILLANQKIYELSQEKESLGGMGTTIVAGFIQNDFIYIANVGDSRAYLIRDESISLLTTDHSWVNVQIKLGRLSEEEARHHPLRNIITRALGTKNDVDVDLVIEPLNDGDIILLCTDGLTAESDDEEIKNIILSAGGDLEQGTDKLIEMANNKGGDDNITVIVIHYFSEDTDRNGQNPANGSRSAPGDAGLVRQEPLDNQDR